MIDWAKNLSGDEKSWLALGTLAWIIAGGLSVFMTVTGSW